MLRIIIGLCCLISVTYGARILVAFPVPGKSHSILGNGFVRELLEDGHEVTYISCFGYKEHKNLRVIDTSSLVDTMPKDFMSLKRLINKEVAIDSLAGFSALLNMSVFALQHPNVIKLLEDKSQNFDAVIVEWLFTEALSGLAAVYQCPLIWSASTEPHWMTMRLIGHNLNPAISPDVMSSHVNPMNFIQRVQMLFSRIIISLLKYWALERGESDLYYSHIAPYIEARGLPVPNYRDVLFNASLMFGNSHVSFGEAMPLPQNYIAIGGYHLQAVKESLPKDLLEIMENAKHGVIYMSMGTNLKSKDLPEEMKRDIVKMLGTLKQTVLWKFEEELPNTPKNVRILNWAPQQSILAHPNCKLFITHGGLLSTTETIYHGKPIIGLPVYGDQFLNVKRAVAKGFALEVEWTYNVAQDLKAAINEILTNPKYSARITEISKIFHSRPVSPSHEIKHWTRHVLETRGAPHLRTPAANLNVAQLYYLDAVALLVIIYFAAKMIIRRIFKSKVQKKLKTK